MPTKIILNQNKVDATSFKGTYCSWIMDPDGDPMLPDKTPSISGRYEGLKATKADGSTICYVPDKFGVFAQDEDIVIIWNVDDGGITMKSLSLCLVLGPTEECHVADKDGRPPTESK